LASDYLELLPLHTQELLRAPTKEIKDAIAATHEHWASAENDFVAILITAEGEVILDKIQNLTEERQLKWGTVILPSEVGGLSQTGLLDTSDKQLRMRVTDVADEPGKRERFVIHRQGDRWLWRQANENTGSIVAESLREASRALAKIMGYQLFKTLEFDLIDIEADQSEFMRALVVLTNPAVSFPAAGDLSAYSKRAQRLDDHLSGAEDAARRITSKLNLPAAIVEAVCLAARWHDKGKNRLHWQKAIGNFTGEPLAKSGHTHFDRRFTRGYRHEFGSLLDAEADSVIQEHPERDLILHLIAAHHGYARPCFSDQAFDRSLPYRRNTQAQEEALRRFALLQARFGWWQLAWLEALVKSADAMGAPND
jgi:CRISPR-associated endonuclease/helicase Cas3